MTLIKHPLVFVIFLTLFSLPVFAGSEKQDGGFEKLVLEVSIQAPANFIYPYLIEEDKIALWNKDDSVKVAFPKGEEPRIGKQIRVSLKNVPTHPWMLMEIKQLQPGREVMTEFIDGVLAGKFYYRLTPQEQGGTLFVHEMQVRPVGFIVALVWEVIGKRIHHEKMERFMSAIKVVVEAAWSEESKKQRPEKAPESAG